MSTTRKGFIFSMDLIIAALLIFLMLFLIIHSFSTKSENSIKNIKNFSLGKNAIFLLDSTLKNNSPENALIGAAMFDGEKHRVKSNELDYTKLKNAIPMQSNEFFVKELSLKWIDGGEEKIFFENAEAANCIGVERIALIENRKVLVKVVLCES